MEPGAFGRLPFAVVAVAVGAIALGVVALGFELKLGVYSLVLLAVPFAVATVYLSQYSRQPYETPHPVGASGESSEEPFDDPVEEADRIAQELAVKEGDPAPTDAETDPDS